MSSLGSAMMAAWQNQGQNPGETPTGGGKTPIPDVHWRHALRPRGKRGPRRQEQYHLVVAAYVIGEILSPLDRRMLVRELWQNTRDVLVLIEPGTPSGFAHIRQARTQVSSHLLAL